MLSVPLLNLGSIDAINYTGRKEKEFLSRVFLRDSFLESILEDKKYFLIGEKGTGKTAYSVLLNNSEYKNTLASIRSLTGTDYTKFVTLKKNSHLQVSNYVDAWKVILLMLSAHHLSEKEPNSVLKFAKFKNLKAAIDEYYKSAFAPEVVNALEFVENSERAISLLSKHVNASSKSQTSEKEQGQGYQTNLLFIERQMRESIASLKLAKSHIVFVDGIDIRPSGIDFETYIECIRGLAEAAWSLNTEFFGNIRDSQGRIKIVLLVRPDIFDVLGYQNTNAKVRDNGIILDWRTTYVDYRGSRIFQLIDGILGKQQENDKPSFGQAWANYFPYKLPNLWAPDRTDDPFVGFLRYSFYRPRDIVSYLLIMQDYVKHHENDKNRFSENSFKSCQSQYSDYLLGEVKDNLSFYYTGVDFEEFTGFFRSLKGATRFNWSHFEKAYSQYRKTIRKKDVTLAALDEGPEVFLQFLYSLNVIGYDERVESQESVFIHWCFRDRTPVKLSPKIQPGLEYSTSRAAYFIHPGLARSLGVGVARV